MNTILFFEDTIRHAEQTEKMLKKKVGENVTIKRFNAKDIGMGRRKKQTRNGIEKDSYLTRLENILKSDEYSNLTLIVTDVNLAELDQYSGLSAEVIIELGKRFSIPVCVYSRKLDDELRNLDRWVDGKIILEDPDSDSMFDEIYSIYKGFVNLQKLCKTHLSKEMSKSISKNTTIILEKPQYSDRFTSYAIGNQAFYSFVNTKISKTDKTLNYHSLAYFIGTWLLTSIFKYPGIFVNEIAAASYLNIHPKDFSKPEVQKIFSKAKYIGPFSDTKKLWWRDELDDIMIKSEVESGLEMVKLKTKLKVRPCLCSVDEKSIAGFYCILTEKPVSRNNSNGDISWIPKGADLSRISNSKMDQYSPWM